MGGKRTIYYCGRLLNTDMSAVSRIAQGGIYRPAS